MSDLDIYDSVRGFAREPVDESELRDALERGTIVEDPRRRRPRYFDGRFLAANDLTRDQQYFLTRQADLGQLGGGGVVEGLDVAIDEPGRSVRIAAGHGITPSGELTLLREEVSVDITDVPTSQRLDHTFGLDQRPRPPQRTRTGLFALCLRPVEYTANPVASYPKSITGERKLEDGDIVEATAITLIPFDGESAPDASRAGRARLAKQIFVGGRKAAMAADALPVAVVALERGRVSWVDTYLVRRDAGADSVLGFGLGHRAVREAFLRQYRDHLDAVVTDRNDRGLDARFPARDYFEALPAAGPLPPGSVEVRDSQLTQWFFPPEMYVELSIVPEDEVPGLFEEALSLAPIDFGMSASALEALPVLILVPVARASFAELMGRLQGTSTRALSNRLSRPLGRARPIDGLQALHLRSLREPEADPAPIDLSPWQDALATSSRLLYVRRRQFAQVSFVIPRHGPLPSEQQPSNTLGEVQRTRLEDAGERDRFDRMMVTAGPDSLEAMEEILSLPIFDTALFVNGLMAELAYRTRRRVILPPDEEEDEAAPARPAAHAPPGAPTPLRLRPLSPEDVEAVASRYRDEELGSGIQALNSAEPDLEGFDIRLVVAQSLRVPELDAQADEATETQRATLASMLLERARNADVNGIRDLIEVVLPPPDAGEPIEDNPASEAAVELGEGNSYRIVRNAADEAYRERIDDLLVTPRLQQRLVVSGMLMELIERGWGLDAGDPEALGAVLLALRQWRPEDGEFVVPTISSPSPPGGIRLSEEGELRIPDDYASLLDVPNVEDATARLVGAGFPDDVEGFRVIGFAGVARELAAWLPDAETDVVETLATSLQDAVAARSQSEIRRAWLIARRS